MLVGLVAHISSACEISLGRQVACEKGDSDLEGKSPLSYPLSFCVCLSISLYFSLFLFLSFSFFSFDGVAMLKDGHLDHTGASSNQMI